MVSRPLARERARGWGWATSGAGVDSTYHACPGGLSWITPGGRLPAPPLGSGGRTVGVGVGVGSPPPVAAFQTASARPLATIQISTNPVRRVTAGLTFHPLPSAATGSESRGRSRHNAMSSAVQASPFSTPLIARPRELSTPYQPLPLISTPRLTRAQLSPMSPEHWRRGGLFARQAPTPEPRM